MSRMATVLGSFMTQNVARYGAWPGGGIKPRPPQSAGRQPGNRAGYPAELAGRRELAALAHAPGEQLLRVGVDRVQVAAIAGDGFVADALLALPGRARYRFAKPQAPIGGDLIARHR